MKTKIFSLLLLFSFFFFVHCKKKTISDIFHENLKEVGININSKIENVYILTDSECMSCNKKFSILLQEQINNSKSLIIINSSGLYYDISDFENKDNVVVIKSNNPAFEKTKIITLKNNTIIREIKVGADNINSLKL